MKGTRILIQVLESNPYHKPAGPGGGQFTNKGSQTHGNWKVVNETLLSHGGKTLLATELGYWQKAGIAKDIEIQVGHPFFKTDLYKTSPAMTDPATGRIYVNPAEYGIRPTTGYSLPFSILHEIGHSLHDHSNSPMEAIRQWGDSKERNVARKVSLYASTGPYEFVAETFAGIATGNKYSRDVLKLYKITRGTKPLYE